MNTTPIRHPRLDRAAATIALAIWTVTLLLEQGVQRAGGRDRGEVLEKVIVVAGFAGMALLVVAWVKPVVMRYLFQIH